jgi:osmoprotectant transport system ATP-binding protein
MLELQNICKAYEGRPVLSDVNLLVPKGATHALIGSSGSGKTTLLRITLGLIPFDKGYVKINDQALLSFTPVEWANRIGYVPQDGGLFPHITAKNNVSLIARLRGWGQTQIEDRVEELRRVVDLDAEILGHFPHEMSGGQRQRVAIMRAAMMDPAVMLLDEPMGALDPVIRRSLQQELKSISTSGEDRAAGHARPRRGRVSRRADDDAARGCRGADRNLRRLVAASRECLRDPVHQCAANLAGRGDLAMTRRVTSRLDGHVKRPV